MTRGRLHRLGDERGQSLVLALLVMTTLAIVLSTVIIFTSSNQRNANYQKSAQLATTLAETGINNAVSVLANPANSCCLEVPWGAGTNAVLPDNSASHPAYSTTYSGGTVSWWGTLNQSTEVWTLHAQSTVSNPTGPSASAIVKNMTAQVQVNPPPSKNINLGVWDTIYSPQATPWPNCDTSIGQGVSIAIPFYVGGNLCMSNNALVNAPLYVGGVLNITTKQSYVGCNKLNGGGNKCQTPAPVTSAHVGSFCQGPSATPYNPCVSENGSNDSNIYVQNPGSWNATGPAADFAGVTAPTICWGPGSCAGDPVGGWYSAASPGPLHPCTTSSSVGPGTTTPPVFDNDTTWGPQEGQPDGSIATNQNLTPPGLSYTCKTAQGELSWNGTNKLTVVGTIFIDGSVSVTDNNAQITYTGWGGSSGNCTNVGDCQAVIFVSGSLTIGGNGSVQVCGLVSGSSCDGTNWNPNDKMLIFAVNGSGGITVKPSGTYFQGGLYATNIISITTSATTQGPLISGQKVVNLGQQSGGSFPPFQALPIAIQGPPQLFSINPPTNFCYSTGSGPNCT
jgi:hypothetical protein